MTPFNVIQTVCSHDCPDSCAVLVTVDEAGKAVKVEGDPTHPVTRGFLCGKVAKYLDRVYSPDRVIYPMRRRTGVAKGQIPHGEEQSAFERMSWDEALDLIADKLQEVSARYGPESILPYSYAGTIAALGYGSMDRRFFHRLGASQLDRTICATAGGDAFLTVYGKKLGTDTEDFHRARLIIAWGANIHGNNVHLWPQIEEARRSGARLIVIDPYRTRTAKLADWHIPIRPGTDGALALGMMHVILRDGLEDAAYIEAHGHGFEALRKRAGEYDPERVAALTGMTPDDVVRLAREYATTVPAVIRMNYGVQRSQNGGTAARAIAMLPAIIGAWKHLGGGMQLSTSGAFSFDGQALERPDLMKESPLGRPARVVNMSQLGAALTTLEQPRVHALFVYNSNPAAIAPNQNAVLRGMARQDLFTVVHEQFFTDTVDYADVLLPATTFLEHLDIQGAYGHYYVQFSQQAIAPVGESRSNVWLFGQLAQRMGFKERCFLDTPEEMIEQALNTAQNPAFPAMRGITPEELKKHGRARLRLGDNFLPFSDGIFPTRSGKIEFYSESLAEQGLDPLPAFVAPVESRHTKTDGAFPLEFLPRKADTYMNSTFANLPWHQRMEKATSGALEMNLEDAAVRKIVNGDAVEVFNSRGILQLRAMVGASVPPGVVAGRLSWNKLSTGGSNVNALTAETLTDIGRGATFYSTLVEVRKVQAGAEEPAAVEVCS